MASSEIDQVIGPQLIVSGSAGDLSSRVYLVFQAAITVIWCISMLFLFVDILYVIRKFSTEFAARRIAHPAIFWVCSIVGAVASFFGMWTVFTNPFSTQLFGKTDWLRAVLTVTLVSLAVIPIVYLVGRRVARGEPLPPEAQAAANP
ncbi:MAG TPA: hypothetical protein VLW53_12320 [Candidatus Eisenbacteria bacterium]|nr:hypothetical protein [Candidatus Eisenbacteria bacterium]